MIISGKVVELGDLVVIIFEFPEKDDILPLHKHQEADNHITIVTNGSFIARGEGWSTEIRPGQLIDWQVGQAHEFIALEPNSKFINIMKKHGSLYVSNSPTE